MTIIYKMKDDMFQINETVPLSGRSGILAELKNNFFTDVVCGNTKTVFCITQSGLLCYFNEKRLLEKWAELRVCLLYLNLGYVYYT